MSATPPYTAQSTPSPRSTPPTKANPHPPIASPSRPETSTSKLGKRTAARKANLPSKANPNSQPSPQAPLRSKHHIPHHPHRHHEHDKSVQTALRQTAQFGELLSPVKGGFLAQGDGRRGARDLEGEGVVLGGDVGSERRVGKELGWGDVRRERERRAEAEALAEFVVRMLLYALEGDIHMLTRALYRDLRKQLDLLSAQATSYTRQLDYTYYSLLSTLPAIAETLSLLRDLAVASQALLHDFTTSTVPALTADMSSQIGNLQETFGKLQSERIAGLESRMRVAREKVDGLGERVESVRTRVQEWEARERDGKRRGRRRVGILWGVLGTLVGLFVVMVVVKDGQNEIGGLDGRTDFEGSRETNKTREIEDAASTGLFIDNGRPPKESRSSAPRVTGQSDDFDARLRMFDEL
ncbi:hypothetical protein MMC13_002996 [Lambiella insularis]|nr:hypothetical protein [Lambiella insularis]